MKKLLTASLLSFVLVSACRDLSKRERGEVTTLLAKQSEIVCAPAPARPSHGATSKTESAESLAAEMNKVTAALRPCSMEGNAATPGCKATFESLRPAAERIGEATRGPTAVVGLAQRFVIEASPPASSCQGCAIATNRLLVGLAKEDAARHQTGRALDTCADAFALKRDAALVGTMVDLTFVTGTMDYTTTSCAPAVEQATAEERARLATSLRTIRSGFPKFEDIVARDRALVLLHMLGGYVETPSTTCDFARRAAASAVKPERELGEAYRVAKEQGRLGPQDASTAKYATLYGEALQKMDALIDKASK